MKKTNDPRRLAASALGLLLCAGMAEAATVLAYRHEGACPTEFDRMTIDGLRLRTDMSVDGFAMTTLVDDGEQLMHQVMHDSRTYMTMESDDDAVDFNSDVARSTLLHARRRVQAVTGLDHAQVMEQARAAQVAACPEMADLGYGDPDYPEAAARCAERMAAAVAADAPASRAEALSRPRARGQDRRPAAAPPAWTTTTRERDGVAIEQDGHRCTVERIRRGGTVLREDCLADVDALGLEPRAVRRLARLAKVGEGLGAGVVDLHPEMQQDLRAGQPTISLRRTCYSEGKPVGHATLGIRTGVAVEPSQFELPAGYEPLQLGADAQDDALDLLEAWD